MVGQRGDSCLPIPLEPIPDETMRASLFTTEGEDTNVIAAKRGYHGRSRGAARGLSDTGSSVDSEGVFVATTTLVGRRTSVVRQVANSRAHGYFLGGGRPFGRSPRISAISPVDVESCRPVARMRPI